MPPYNCILGLAGYVPRTSAFLSAIVQPYGEHAKGGALMTRPHVVPQPRIFLWVLRIALLALGLTFMLHSIRTGAYRELFGRPAMEEGNLL
jgi:hypothetical protein